MATSKKAIFDDFLNFLQSLRYCSRYQKRSNHIWLEGFRRDWRSETSFELQLMMWEISRFWSESHLPVILLFTLKIEKIVIFDDFSNFFQSRRYCSTFQTHILWCQGDIYCPAENMVDRFFSVFWLKMRFWAKNDKFRSSPKVFIFGVIQMIIKTILCNFLSIFRKRNHFSRKLVWFG